MKKFSISKTRRLRSTPFTSRLEKYGVGGYTIYNHMLLPTFFQSLEEEYEHLKNHVKNLEWIFPDEPEDRRYFQVDDNPVPIFFKKDKFKHLFWSEK